MTEIETAREQLREMARDLETIKYRLLGVLASVPLSPSEADPDQEADSSDPTVQFRGDVECLLSDQLEPLIQDLLDAAIPGTAGTPETSDTNK